LLLDWTIETIRNAVLIPRGDPLQRDKVLDQIYSKRMSGFCLTEALDDFTQFSFRLHCIFTLLPDSRFVLKPHKGVKMNAVSESNTPETNLPKKRAIRSPLVLKMMGLAALLMGSLIPGCLIHGLIRDRQTYEEEAISSVINGWAAWHEVGAVTFEVPYHYVDYNEKDKTSVRTDHSLNLIPSNLSITSSDSFETRKRGIFEIPIYKAKLEMSGEFEIPKDLVPEGSKEIQTLFAQKLKLGFKHSEAISEFAFKLNDKPMTLKRTTEGFVLNLPEKTFYPGEKLKFQLNAQLNGHKGFDIRTEADLLEVNMSSRWPHPSFQGQLPVDQTISKAGFTARWKLIQPQLNQRISVGFMSPVNHYSQTSRALKYSFLITLLVLTALFLIETLWSMRIHAMQYLLMTLPLSVFYVLLLAVSEQTGFLTAYISASGAVMGLLFIYFKAIGATLKQSFVLITVIAGVKALIYTMLSSEDFALLIGSISLFLTLSAFMLMTAKVNWTLAASRQKQEA
jgi:inner membrane protein